MGIGKVWTEEETLIASKAFIEASEDAKLANGGKKSYLKVAGVFSVIIIEKQVNCWNVADKIDKIRVECKTYERKLRYSFPTGLKFSPK